MDETSKVRKRSVQVISLVKLALSLKGEDKLSGDPATLILNLREILVTQSGNHHEINSTVIQYIDTIQTKIQQLSNLSQPTETLDILQATLKTYINELVSITNCLDDPSYIRFQQILSTFRDVEKTLDLRSQFLKNPSYAFTVCNRSFDLLSLPLITDFLTEKSSDRLSLHIVFIIEAITHRIQSTIEFISFKRNDLQNQIPIIRLLLDYMDKNLQSTNEVAMYLISRVIISFIWNLADDTMLVPNMIETNCPNYVLQWISMKDLSLNIQHSCLNILHNLARHEKGVIALNNANGIKLLKEFKQRILDPNKNNEGNLYVNLRLVYCMTLSLLTEPKENREDLANLRKILDQLIQLAVDAGQSENDSFGGFHVSEPIVVLAKLFVHDEILHYVLNQAPVRNVEANTKIEFFCQLLMKFRGALASENDIDQLTLTALFNIMWSISIHDEYIEELKSDPKFIMTVKSLANDDGEALVEQYVPKHMSSISKAAGMILWNLDENNPARAGRTTDADKAKETTQNDNIKSNRIRVMVSYCHADREFCQQLVNTLQKDNCLDIWVDFAYCHTEDLWEEIGEAIEKSHVVLFLMSKDYQDSKSCRQEVMYTKDSLKKRFIPVYIKKEFTATGWLGVRIVGPQYIRFGKKSFDDTIKELIKLINEDKKSQEPEKKPETKPSTVTSTKPIENTNNETKPIENNHIESNLKPSSKKPIEQWRKSDITQWFNENSIHEELIDLYDFKYGTDLLLYGQCLRPDWQTEYNDMRERYQQKYNTPLYRDQFVRFVGAINRLTPSQSNSKLCIIS